MSGIRAIEPVSQPIDTWVRPPGSKSETIRALFLASLAKGDSVITHALDSDDTRHARDALSAFGIDLDDSGASWSVMGTAGHFGSISPHVNAGASGLTARCLMAIAPLVNGTVTIDGRHRLPERPMAPILEALAGQGVAVTSRQGRLPVQVIGTGALPGGDVRVDSAQSSQFATALLMAAPLATHRMRVFPTSLAGSAGYLDMTLRLMGAFGVAAEPLDGGWSVPNSGYVGTSVSIEPDASAAVYPMTAAAITGGRVTIEGLGGESLQPDARVADVLGEMGCSVEKTGDTITIDARSRALVAVDADLSSSPDGALAIAVAALFALGDSRLRGLGSLRFKESDRLTALGTELSRLGADITIEEDDLLISPRILRPSTMETYRDHRMAMSLALVGLSVPGIAISDPEVVDKTWPGFWEMLENLGIRRDRPDSAT
ncbi:MAG: 3-phosphoshikimate 1-carboxyvinyltransferase [Acidimicrobiia bacterium]